MTGFEATRIAHSDLVLGAPLGGGGQGKVWTVERRLINRKWPVAYKEYKPDWQGQLRVEALERMVAFLPEQHLAVGQWLAEHSAWPAALVTEGPQVRGFLMRQIPDEFFISMPSGDAKAAGFEYLLNPEPYVNKMVGAVTPRHVLGLLLALADILERLHGLGVVAGDLSPKNLLFSLSGPRPDCFLIDCDAMGLGGDWVLKPVQTPGWQLPDGEAPETPEGDRYKFALLAVRLFLQEQYGEDTTALRQMDGDVADLAERGLSRTPTDRPPLSDWLDPLRRALDSAPATWSDITQAEARTTAHVATPEPTGTTPTVGTHTTSPSHHPILTPQRAPSSRRVGRALVVLALIAFIIWQIARHNDSGGNDGSNGTSQTGVGYTDSRESQATALHTLLAQNADRRRGVSDAVASMMKCSRLPQSRRVFENAADARADLVEKLDTLSLDQLSDDLPSNLRSAWQRSEDADRAYVRVADNVSGGCSASAVTASSAWRDAASASAGATRAKKDFVTAWNPVARDFGLGTFAWSDL
ncbi:hypothetical protein [Streptomyces sp. NPDC057682]|uniref:hypothetical protein n=1 Tax=Streptomyces sp. NPDC057682 TaxID=3346210 RepID=UPI003694C35E